MTNFNKFEELVCPYCKNTIRKKSETVTCPRCEAQHHKNCWEEHGGCATPDCYANPNVKEVAENVGNKTIDEILHGRKDDAIEKVYVKGTVCPECGKESGPGESKCTFCGHDFSGEPKAETSAEFEEEFRKRYREKAGFRLRLRIALYTSIALVSVLIVSSLIFSYIRLNEYYNSEEYRVRQFVKEWKYALESKDIFKYKDLLDRDYQYIEKSGKPVGYDERSKRIEKMFETYKKIRVQTDDINITKDTSQANYTNVTFNQTITLDKKEEKGKKTLRLYRDSASVRWKIFREYFE